MKNYLFILLIGISILIRCNSKPHVTDIASKYSVLTGDWKNYPDGWIYIENVLSGQEDSAYVKNGKFTLQLNQAQGSYYNYLQDETNFYLLYLTPGDTLVMDGEWTGQSFSAISFKGKRASHNYYLDELLIEFESRSEKLTKIFTYTSLDSLLAFHQMEIEQTNSRIKKYLPDLLCFKDSLFVYLEKKRIEWKHINDIIDFPQWYYFYSKQPFSNSQFVDDVFKKQDLSDSLTFWLPESIDAMKNFFINEYYRLAKQWKEKTPEKNNFLLDFWKYALAEYGYFPAMQLLVPTFLHTDISIRLEKSSINFARQYFQFNPTPNYKNKYLKSVLTSVEQLKEGQMAPQFTMVDLTDTFQKYPLSHFLGKELIVEFGSTYCGGCLQAANMIKTDYDKIKNKSNVAYLYVLVEEHSDRIHDFSRKNKFPFSVFRVDNHSLNAIHNNYALFIEPRFVWIDKHGKLKDPFLQGPWSDEFWKEIDKL